MSSPESLLVSSPDPRRRFDPWKLRCWREVRCLSQRELAEVVGWGRNGNETVSRIESLAIEVGPARLARLAKGLEVEPDELLSEPEELGRNFVTSRAWVEAGRPDLRTWLRERAS